MSALAVITSFVACGFILVIFVSFWMHILLSDRASEAVRELFRSVEKRVAKSRVSTTTDAPHKVATTINPLASHVQLAIAFNTKPKAGRAHVTADDVFSAAMNPTSSRSVLNAQAGQDHPFAASPLQLPVRARRQTQAFAAAPMKMRKATATARV